MYTYLILNILIIFFPLKLSFDKKLKFYSHFEDLSISILFGGFFMVLLDMFFVKKRILVFMPEYLIKTNLISLPIEEILFFITVPFACIFVYEYLKIKIKKDFLSQHVEKINLTLIFLLTALMSFSFYKTYTFTIAIFLDVLLYLYFIKKLSNKYMGYFYLSYLVTLIPFLILNIILAKGVWFISGRPIIWYEYSKTWGLKLLSVPVENIMYFMFFSLLYISIYEFSKSKKIAKS